MTQKKAIIIGAGFGGLASALRLKKKGYDVTLVEKCDDPGGRARTFDVNGYKFDAGPTVITAPYLFDELFTMFGKDIARYVNIKPLETVWYRYQYADGSTLDYGPQEFFLEELAEKFPDDVEGYLALYKKAEAIFDLGYIRLADQPFHDFSVMFKQVFALLKHHGFNSVYDLVGRYIRSDRLRQALCSAPLLLGGDPRRTSAIYFLIHILEQKYGVHYALGGTRRLVEALTELATENGVRIDYGKTVTVLQADGHKINTVICADGTHYGCDSVVYNGDPAHLYKDILAGKKQSLFTKIRTRLNAPSMGLLVVYFVTNRRYDDVKHHTIGFGKSYHHILDNIFKNNALGKDLSFYLHRPADTEPEAISPEQDLFYVLVPVPNLKAGDRREDDYKAYADLVLQTLEDRLLPNLQDHIIAQHYVSPRYFKESLLSSHGAGFSLQPRLTQSAWFRYHNQDPYYQNLYIAGAGAHPGAGLPGVLNAAKIVSDLIE